MKKNEIVLATVIIFLLALTRLMPHPMNFTPIIAMGLFSGLIFKSKTLRWVVPISAMLLSDLLIGTHNTMISVYLSLGLIVVLGANTFKLTKNTWLSTGLGAVFGSVLFFLVTNFNVWAVSGMYTKDLSGLMHSYAMAVPFFHNTLASTFIFSFAAVFAYKKISSYELALNK